MEELVSAVPSASANAPIQSGISKLMLPPSFVFGLPEYDRAQVDVFFSAVQSLMKAKDELYRQIATTDRFETTPTTQNTMPSGATVVSEPVTATNTVRFTWGAIKQCNVDTFAEEADRVAEERLQVIIPHLFSMIDRTCTAAGTAVNSEGVPFSFETYITAISKIELSFDASGEPVMPTLVIHPETAKLLERLPPPSEDQQKRLTAIIDAKRKEYLAKRRHRKLS